LLAERASVICIRFFYFFAQRNSVNIYDETHTFVMKGLDKHKDVEVIRGCTSQPFPSLGSPKRIEEICHFQ
jgi:hypothetical protein